MEDIIIWLVKNSPVPSSKKKINIKYIIHVIVSKYKKVCCTRRGLVPNTSERCFQMPTKKVEKINAQVSCLGQMNSGSNVYIQ